jgi:predicted DNA-binding transcriptional regulator AlpA
MMTHVINDEDLLSTEDLVRWTGYSKQAFEGWRSRRNGGPPFIKFAQAVRYRRADVRAWIDANRVVPESVA